MPSLTPRKSRASGRVTLNDVAALAGVSAMTVSRVLRGQTQVDPQLAERVQQAVDTLAYMPDPAARALASHRSRHVAVLIPMLSNALFVDLLEAVQNALHCAGYQMLIGITHYDPREEEQLLREHLLHRPAGILVTGLGHSAVTQTLLDRCGVPSVHLMELNADPGRYSVGLSQRDAAAAMTRHLLLQGHRRIAFAAAQLDPRTLQRMEGWRQTLQQAGLHDPALEWMNPAPSSLDLGARLFAQIVRQQPGVDAIFFCNDDLAQGALLAALRLGVKVPDQVAVAGFNDLRGSDQMWPPLTTIRTPRAEIGTAAAGMLLQLMEGLRVDRPMLDLGFELVVRASA